MQRKKKNEESSTQRSLEYGSDTRFRELGDVVIETQNSTKSTEGRDLGGLMSVQNICL